MSAQPRQASTSSAQSRRSGGGGGASWEDEAWAIDSDDEDFVTRQARGAAAASRSTAPPRPGVTSRTSSGAATSSSNLHAPPARPHPYPIPGAVPIRAAPNINTRASRTTQPSVSPSSATGGAVVSGSAGSWTMVDPRARLGVSPDSESDAVASGRSNAASPESTGTDADEASSSSPAGRNGDAAKSRRLSEASEASRTSMHAHGRGKKANEKEREEMKRCLRDDVGTVVEDPTALLTKLSLNWASDPTSSAPLSPLPTPSTATSQLPSAALSGAGFPTGGEASSPLNSSAPPFAQQRGSRGMDAVSMGGDGLIVSGGFGASEADLPAQAADEDEVATPVAASGVGVERKNSTRTQRRRERFLRCLGCESVSMDELRTLAWSGMPNELRPMVWQLLLGYLPPSRVHRASVLARKRAEYAAGARLAFQRGTEGLDQAIWHQIRIDVPRTNPGIALWQREATQRALERILYVWAIRHPASGYVQGINDLATPFFQVFLSAYISTDPEMYDVGLLPPQALEALEADTFWCLSKLLDGIQDNYIFAQPGIQRQVRRMAELVSRIDPPLHAHLQEQGVEYMQFAFRWMNCLLMREMSVRNIVRMWDTYLAEGPDAFSDFHLYVCSVFLSKWSAELLTMDFQGIIMFLQSLPTQNWSDRDAEVLLSDAFVKKSLFGGTAHLTN